MYHYSMGNPVDSNEKIFLNSRDSDMELSSNSNSREF